MPEESNAKGLVSLKEHLMSIIDERDRRYANEMSALKQQITDTQTARTKSFNDAVARVIAICAFFAAIANMAITWFHK